MNSKRSPLPLTLLLLLATFGVCLNPVFAQDQSAAVRATLPNGMRVVIIRNTLAPVVTVEANFLVGGDETPAGFPGMAHAQEHMAFRGCAGMTADQTSAIYAQLGGRNNADTQQNITQYFATVPAADLDVALQAQAACLHGIDDSQQEWAQERGAIEQEVARDLSNPTYKFLDRLDEDMFAATPYAHDPLGTKDSFDATTGEMLKDFYDKWYTPSNCILVIVGDVDAAATMKKVQQWFGDVPSHPLPARPSGRFDAGQVGNIHARQQSSLPARLHRVSFSRNRFSRLCGERRFWPMCWPASAPTFTEWCLRAKRWRRSSEWRRPTRRPASVTAWWPCLPKADGDSAIKEMRSILANYAQKGVPEDLVAAAIRSEVAQAEFQRNSIPGLANVWSNALAAEGRNSPDEDIDAIKRVTLADVNRVAKLYLADQNSITATLKPVPTGQPVSAKGFGGAEEVTSAPTKPVKLPAWAASALAELESPGELHRGFRHEAAQWPSIDCEDRSHQSDGFGASAK